MKVDIPDAQYNPLPGPQAEFMTKKPVIAVLSGNWKDSKLPYLLSALLKRL